MATSQATELFERVRQRADDAGVFGSCEVRDGMLVCEAKEAAEDAFYRLELDGGRLWVALVMADRWQSESIESDLMHTGDKLEELLEEELVDLGYDGKVPGFEHFRSDDMLFTFRTPVPADAADASATEIATMFLLGYEACFRQLGDMSGGDED